MKNLRILIFVVVCFYPVPAYPQSISKRVSENHDDRPPLALIAARAEYIYRLEKLLALQESDLQTNEDYLENNRPLLEQKMVSDRDLKQIQFLIENTKELIKCTRELLAKAELWSLTQDDYRQPINRHKEPYDVITLLRVLKLNSLPEAEIRAAIEKRGVDFETNAIVERELMNAGASKELLGLIRSSYRGHS
jgi:hypothetical protein